MFANRGFQIVFICKGMGPLGLPRDEVLSPQLYTISRLAYPPLSWRSSFLNITCGVLGGIDPHNHHRQVELRALPLCPMVEGTSDIDNLQDFTSPSVHPRPPR